MVKRTVGATRFWSSSGAFVLSIAGAVALLSSCGLAGSSSTTGGFGGSGAATSAASTSGDGGFRGPAASAGSTTSSSSTTSTSGSGGSGGGASASGGGGAGGDCTPSDGVSCCEDDVACTDGQMCCLDTDGSGLTCAHDCGGHVLIPCETSAGCPMQMPACCAHWHHGPPSLFDMIGCMAACAPPGDPASMDGTYQLCDVSESDCVIGTCTSDARLGGADHGYCLP